MYRRYLIILTLLLALCLPPLGASYVYLRNSGELQSMETMAEQQAASSEFCLVGPALNEDLYHYKLALYRAYKPDVVVLGSSRVLQFRAGFFKGRFLNMGSSLRELAIAEHLLDEMLSTHKPGLIVLGIDPWWFNKAVEKTDYKTQAPGSKIKLNVIMLARPLLWLWQEKIGTAYFVKKLNPYVTQDKCRIGVSATEENSGFGPDGSYYYTGIVTGEKPDSADVGFASTLNRIRGGRDRFQHGRSADAAHIRMFLEFVSKARQQGIEVVTFMPPFAPRVAAELAAQGEAYAYLDDLRAKLRKARLDFHDFMDPTLMSATDCEFVDGFHGGDVAYARILKLMAETDQSGFSRYLDLPRIDAVIRDHAGLAMTPDSRVTQKPEVDFLQLGCRKDPPRH